MQDNRIFTIGILIILIAILVFCIFLYKRHWAQKMKEIQHWCIEKFIWAELWGDENPMWESMSDWSYWCPNATKECRVKPRCTQCRAEYGWYEIMRAKYCERSDPNADPRIFIKAILEARRDHRDHQGKC